MQPRTYRPCWARPSLSELRCPLCKVQAPLGASKPQASPSHPAPLVVYPRSRPITASDPERVVICRRVNQGPDCLLLSSRAKTSQFSAVCTPVRFLVGGNDREGRGNGKSPGSRDLGWFPLRCLGLQGARAGDEGGWTRAWEAGDFTPQPIVLIVMATQSSLGMRLVL